jgi:hypothetical protein
MGEKIREHTKPVVKPITELCVRDLLAVRVWKTCRVDIDGTMANYRFRKPGDI